jgi:predicted metalloprotease with PDZ domain
VTKTTRTSLLTAAFTIFLGLLLNSLPAVATIRYQISLAHPDQHLFHVTMEIPDVQGELTLQMAAWNALYQIRDFSSHVQDVEASANGQPIEVKKLDKLTWKLQAHGTVAVRYASFWDDPGPFNTQLNLEHAFINPAIILLYIPDRRREGATITLQDVPVEWKAASASMVSNNSLAIAGHSYQFEAPSFDALADAPIEVSKFEEFTLPGITPTIQVVMHGDNWKKRDVESALRKICAYEIKLMEGAPYDHYTFIFHSGKASGGAGGGMEHSSSTAINIPSDAVLPNVSAHEFFHLWNVKRIRPATLEPLDYTREMYTRSLWFAEGVTSTYGSFTLLRSGLWTKQEFYQDLGSQISQLEIRPAAKWQSVEQSSLDAWLEKYPLYNQPLYSVSYYTKGQILGDLLDILIRDRTDNQKSLDDVLRTMNVDFAKTGKYYQDSMDVRLTAEKVAGGSFSDFFTQYVSAADPLPYASVLPLAGLELKSYESLRAALGFYVDRDLAGAWIVRNLDNEGTAAAAGLRVGDEILHWNTGDMPRRPDRWVLQQKPGDNLQLQIKREDKELSMEFRLGEIREKFYQVVEQAHASDRARRIREGMLHGTTDPVTAGNR